MSMDDERELMDEFERLQSNITSLFKNVINDRKKYKDEKEKSIESLESFMTEITILRKENEQLRRSNNGRSSCVTCSELREQLMLQDTRSKKLEKSLDVLREMIYNVPYKDSNPHFSKLSEKFDELTRDSHQQKETRSSSTTRDNYVSKGKEEDEGIMSDTFYEKTGPNDSKVSAMQIDNTKKIQAKETQGEESYLNLISSGAESKARFELMDAEFHTPKKVDGSEVDYISSPSCSDGIKKGEISPILIDAKLLLSRNSFPVSPNYLKRKASETVSTSTGKFNKRTLFPKSPKQRKYKSPVKESRIKSTSQLKSTTTMEAEISLLGVRKLKQTQLNLDYYKSRSQDGESSNTYNSNQRLNDENKFSEDDLILESPKYSVNFFDEYRKTIGQEESEESTTSRSAKQSTPVKHEVFDPEETFVSSMFIRNNVKELKIPEREKKLSPNAHEKLGLHLNLAQDNRQREVTNKREYSRSPEYNTVPYPYKGSPVRKKIERMRLPGQTCMECNKYYKAILGEIDPKKLQEILNQCSRHRDEHYNVEETPPGYWKPYLTATMDGSTAEDDDTHLD